METLLDLKSLSIEEAIDHLRAVEQRKKPTMSKEIGDRLLLMQEEWMAMMKSRDGSSSNTGACNSGANSSGKSGGKNKNAKPSMGEAKKSLVGCDDVCGYCSKKGHWAL
jgi:hypothetical protein